MINERTHLVDLVSETDEILYVKHRLETLRKVQTQQSLLKCDQDYEEKIESLHEQNQKEISQREQKIKESFIRKVKEKEAEFHSREENVISILKV